MFDDDIPLPSGNGRKKKYELEGIQVGQSKWFEFNSNEIASIANLRASLIASVKHSNPTYVDAKYSTSRQSQDGKDGIRIWRVK